MLTLPNSTESEATLTARLDRIKEWEVEYRTSSKLQWNKDYHMYCKRHSLPPDDYFYYKYCLYGAFQGHLIRRDCLEAIAVVRDRDYRQMEPSQVSIHVWGYKQIWDPILLRDLAWFRGETRIGASALPNFPW